MNKPIVEIWDSVGLGIIIKYPTGILISNQTGGTACLHPKIEGVYVPLANDYTEKENRFISPEIELSNYFKESKHNGTGATKGLDIADVKKLDTILEKWNLDFIEIDLENLTESHEAWIQIKIKENTKLTILKNFNNYPLRGILTWANSD